MSNLGKKIIIIVLVLAIVAVVASLWWKSEQVDNVANLSAVDQALNLGNQTDTGTRENVSLLVDDQFPGQAIFVSSVVLPKGGWVVIHHGDNGQPGTVAGAGYFGPGVNTGEINLTVPTKEGENYLALLYRDNGDTSFSAKLDQVYLDANNQPVSISFKVTENLPEHKG